MDDPKIRKCMDTIYSYLAVSNKPRKADVIFAATGTSIEPARKVAELYKKGFAKYIFIVGKHGTFSDHSWKEEPALVYKNELIKLDIPDDSLFINPIAKNSREEAKMSISWMKKEGINPENIIIVDTPKHQLREWATFKNFFPDIQYINVPADEKLIYDQDTLDRLVAEIGRLIEYPLKGIIFKVKIPSKVVTAYKYLRPHVKKLYESSVFKVKWLPKI